MFALLNRIQLQDPDEGDDEDRCSIVVSLMRIDRKRTPATEKPPIGFAIYKVKTHSRKIGFLKYGLPIFLIDFFFQLFLVRYYSNCNYVFFNKVCVVVFRFLVTFEIPKSVSADDFLRLLRHK